VQRSLASQKAQVLRIAGAAVCVILALLFGALITKAVLSMLEGFGGIVGSELPESISMGIGSIIGAALCALGFRAGKANDDKELARRVLIVVAVLSISFALVEIVKLFMSRPRPFIVLAGYEGIAFCPWYSKFSGAEDFITAYGIGKDAFKSFPSGHSLQAAAVLPAFFGLSLVYPKLQKKLGIALVVEIVFALTVMACRMILGAHFLSDVSMGALVSVIAFFALMALQDRVSRGPEPHPDESVSLQGGHDERETKEEQSDAQ
jgi:membrane-associated phospholipid phosphatase